MTHDVQWYSPAPLWTQRLENGTRDRLQRPELLQFEQDDFMGALQKMLDGPASHFHESVRDGAGPKGKTGGDEAGQGPPLPLYHPANERYYLLTASLVCREHGLPDRAVDTTNDERVSFVLRRLVPEESTQGDEVREYGWFGEEQGWHPITPDGPPLKRQVQENGTARTIEETRLSMFPQNYDPETPQDRMKSTRRLWAGLIPVAKRETYETAPVRHAAGTSDRANTDSQDSSALRPDPRKPEFQARVINPLQAMKNRLENGGSASAVRDPLLFAWLDLWQFLDRYLPDVAETILDQQEDSVDATDFTEKGTQKVTLLDRLDSVDVPDMKLGDHPTDVLRTIKQNVTDLEAGALDQVLPPDDLTSNLRNDIERLLREDGSNGDAPQLARDVYAALPALDPDSLSPELQSLLADTALGADADGGVYVARCVYERPECPPSRRIQVSDRTRSFRLASFFDAEAPSRDISITMPGITMDKLRGSPQSVTMHFTEELSNQAGKIQREALKGLGVEDGKSINLGRVCSLSIPIITICALVLLLVIVVVLNIVFWWLPFFKICLPLPSSLTGDS
ncbi:MAG: hypothetical protein V5A22_00155 [Salinivenus sp.]